MAFINETDKIQQWKYTITEFTLLYSGKTYEVPTERITELSITNNYDKDLFPIINLSVTFEPSVYSEMVQNKNDVKLKVRIQKFYTESGSEEKSLLRDYINTTFSLLLDDDYLNPDRSVRAEVENNTEEKVDDVNSLQYLNNKNDFPLYKYETIEAARTMINTVLTNVTMIGALAFIGATAKLSKILVSPLENNKTYSELLLPPQTALSTVQYLDSEYGFYKSGGIVFFGVDRTYIINFKGGCTAYEKNEIKETCILVPDKSGSYGSIECGLEKPEEKTLRTFLVVKAEHVDMKNPSISNDVIDGNNAVIVNTNTNSITTAVSGTTQRGTGNSSVINTNTSNEWIGETYAAQKTADSAVATVSCGGFDADAITPNKKFTFLFEDTKNSENYKGTYILTQSVFKFTKDGSDLSLDASMTFKRAGGTVSVSSEDL